MPSTKRLTVNDTPSKRPQHDGMLAQEHIAVLMSNIGVRLHRPWREAVIAIGQYAVAYVAAAAVLWLGKPDPFDLCYYMSVPEYRRLFPEFAWMPEMALVKKIYADAGTPTRDIRNPWVNKLGLIAWALAIPLVFLAIGSAIMWAFAGFKCDTA